MTAAQKKPNKDHSWKDTRKIINLSLLNVYKGKIIQSLGIIVHLITKLQLLALYLRFTLEIFPDSSRTLVKVVDWISEILVFQNLFVFSQESASTQAAFIIISIYTVIMIMLLLFLLALLLRKGHINENLQSFWGLLIYIHCLIFIFPCFNFNVAAITHWARGDLKIFNLAFADQTLVPAFTLTTLIWNICLIMLLKVFLLTSIYTNGPLHLKTTTIQQWEIIEKCVLSLIFQTNANTKILSWLIIILALFMIIGKNIYTFRYLPYFNIQVQGHDVTMNSLITVLALLNLIARVISGTRHSLGSPDVILAWLLFCPFAIKLFRNRVRNIYSTLLRSSLNDTNPSQILHRIPLYNLFLKKKIDFNPKADTIDFLNLYIKGKSKIMKPYIKETGEQVSFDLTNDQHFKMYSLSLLKESIQLHNKDWPLKVGYIKQLMEYGYYIQALYFMEQTNRKPLSFTQEIVIYLLKSEIEHILINKYSNKRSEKLNMLNFLQSTSMFEKLRYQVMQQVKEQQNFWHIYLPAKIDFKALVDLSNKIESKKLNIQRFWNDYEIVADKNFILAYLTYGIYLELANYRPTNGSLIINQYLRKTISIKKVLAKDELSNDTIFAEDNICIEISGVKETLGNILECSQAIKKVFGYAKEDLIGVNISALVPDWLKDKHNNALFRYYETGTKTVLNHTRQVLAMTSSGYLLPARLHVRLNPFLENKISYVGVIKPIKQKTSSIIVLPNGVIDGITKDIALELGILPNSRINIAEICPEFRMINEVTNKIAYHQISGKDTFEMLFMNQDEINQSNTIKRKEFNSYKSTAHEDFVLVSPSQSDRKFLMPTNVENTSPSKNSLQNIFFKTFGQKTLQGLDYESCLQLYSKYTHEGLEVTFHCFQDDRQPSYEGPRYLKAQINVANMIVGRDWVKIVSIKSLAAKKAKNHSHVRSLALKSIEVDPPHSFPSRSSKDEKTMKHQSLSRTRYDFSVPSFGPFRKSSSNSSADEGNCNSDGAFKLNSFRLAGDSDIPEIVSRKSSLLIKEGPYENLERRNLPTLRLIENIVEQSDNGMYPDSKHESLDEFRPAKINQRRTKEMNLSETESNNNEDVGNKDRTNRIKNEEAKLKYMKIKNFNQLNDTVSRDGVSEFATKRKIQKGLESALECRHKTKKFTYFTLAFVLCMLLIALALFVQMMISINAFHNISTQNQIITMAKERLDALVLTNFLLRVWYCIIEGKYGYIPDIFYNPLTESERVSVGSSITTLSDANHNLIAAVTLIDKSLQDDFYARDVRVFDISIDGLPEGFTMDNTFSAIEKIVSKGLKFIKAPTYPLYQPNQDMEYFLYNCYNDLFISNENSVQILLDDSQKKVENYGYNIWGISSSTVVVLLLFLLSSLTIISQIKKSVLKFGTFFFTIKDNDVKTISTCLHSFHKALANNYQDEALLAHLHITEQVMQVKDEQSRVRLDQKEVSYSRFHSQNKILVLRLWPLILLVIGLFIGLSVMKRHDIDHVSVLRNQCITAGNNLITMNLAVSILVEMVGANLTTTIKNQPILDQFNIVLGDLAESSSLVNEFTDSKRRIESTMADLLFNFSCNTNFEGQDAAFNRLCYNISGQRGYTSIVSLNNIIWQYTTEGASNFLDSNRTVLDQILTLTEKVDEFVNIMTVARQLNLELWRRVLTDFKIFLGTQTSQTIEFSVYFEIFILMVSLAAFPLAIAKLNNKDDELKKMLKVVPLNIIVKNRWLKTYLINHSNRILDPLRNTI